MTASSKAGLLAELRSRIRRLEGIAGEGGRVLSLGPGLDEALPENGLPLGCVHEVLGGSETDSDPWRGAAIGFAAAVAGRIAASHGPAVWLTRDRDLYAPGLAAYGLGPERLIVVQAGKPADLLWATEEVLRCRGVGVALAEIGTLDLAASRRLQLAAEGSGVTGLLLRYGARPRHASAAVTRWALAPAPSRTDGEPGVGASRWHLRLLRCRGGQPGEWLAEWQDKGFAILDQSPGAADAERRARRPAEGSV